MTTQARTTVARQMGATSLAINNTLGDKEIYALVAAYGYTNAKLDEGRQIHALAADAVTAQSIAAGAYRQATEQVRAAEQRARASYQALAQLARAVFPRQPAGGVCRHPEAGRVAALGAAHARGRNPRRFADERGSRGARGEVLARGEEN